MLSSLDWYATWHVKIFLFWFVNDSRFVPGAGHCCSNTRLCVHWELSLRISFSVLALVAFSGNDTACFPQHWQPLHDLNSEHFRLRLFQRKPKLSLSLFLFLSFLAFLYECWGCDWCCPEALFNTDPRKRHLVDTKPKDSSLHFILKSDWMLRPVHMAVKASTFGPWAVFLTDQSHVGLNEESDFVCRALKWKI